MLDYRIETFITLCKERNYSKTAQKLCITQPAVTQHIQYLERYYNCKLFIYENKQLKLTTQGMILERMALGLNASSTRFKALIQELEEKERTFSLGASATVSECIMPPIIASLLKDDSSVNLNIHVDSGENLITSLKNGDLECAFIEGSFNRQELKYYKFTTEDYVLVSSKKFEKITIDDLLNEIIITREPGSACHELLTTELGKYGKTIQDFRKHVYVNNVSFIKQLLQSGTGVGLVYKRSIQKELNEGLLHEVPIEMDLSQDFHFVMLKDNMFMKDYEDFFHYATSIYSKSKEEA